MFNIGDGTCYGVGKGSPSVVRAFSPPETRGAGG